MPHGHGGSNAQKMYCPVVTDGEVCGGEIQLSRRTYWSIIDNQLVQVQVTQPDMWQVYCSNDHTDLAPDEKGHSEWFEAEDFGPRGIVAIVGELIEKYQQAHSGLRLV